MTAFGHCMPRCFLRSLSQLMCEDLKAASFFLVSGMRWPSSDTHQTKPSVSICSSMYSPSSSHSGESSQSVRPSDWHVSTRLNISVQVMESSMSSGRGSAFDTQVPSSSGPSG